jgi:hypothetical protein
MTQFQKCFIARLVVVAAVALDKKIAGRKTFSSNAAQFRFFDALFLAV